MAPRCHHLLSTWLVFVLCHVGFGCADPGGEYDNDTTVDAGAPDAEVTDADADPDTGDVDAGPMGPDEFEKPPKESHHEELRKTYRSDDEVEPDNSDDSRGLNGGFVGRPHMRFTEDMTESWVYDDEFLVFDGHVLHRNYGELPDFEILVTYEGERLPMAFVEVEEEGGFPTLEEIEEWPEEKFGYSETVEVNDWEFLNYTIVVPPWAFPEKGAYNIEVLLLPIHEPEPGGRFRGYFNLFNSTKTVYFNSELYHSDHEQVPSRQEDAEEVEDLPILAPAVWLASGMFLAPPTDVYAWDEYDYDGQAGTDNVNDWEMADIFEVEDDEVTVEFYHMSVGWASRFVEAPPMPTWGENLYYVLQDGEPVEVFLFEPRREELHIYSDDPGDRIEIDIELPDDGFTRVEIVAIPNPYQPYSDELVEDEMIAPPMPAPKTSNMLFFEQAEEETDN